MFDSDQQSKPQQKLIFPRKQQPYLQSKQNLQRLREISRGSFGEVYQYYNSLKNQFYAVKKMKFNGRKDYRTINQIQRQIDLLYKANSPYLVKLLDHFEDENFEGPSYVYLVMQYIDGKNLCDAIFKPKIEFQYKIICEMITDICTGLQYLHQNNIVHRDIKLQNIMLSSKGTIKIIDLGESNFYGDNINRKTMRGTKTYFSPEILNHDQQDDKVDVWCVGVIIYELVCFQSPFQGSSEKEILENIRRFRYPIPQKIKHQKQLLDLLSKIFTWQVSRISISGVKNHPWIKKNIQENSIPKFETLFKQYQLIEYRKILMEEIEKVRNQIMVTKQSNKQMEVLINAKKGDVQKIKRRSNQVNL